MSVSIKLSPFNSNSRQSTRNNIFNNSDSNISSSSQSLQPIFDQFENAIRYGNISYLNILNERYPESTVGILDFTNSSLQSLLHILAISGCCREISRVEIAEILCERLNSVGVDIKTKFATAKDDSNRAPLHYAAKLKRDLLLKWFVEKDYLDCTFEEDTDYLSPFHYIVECRRFELVEIAKLYWDTVGKNYIGNFQRYSPLHIAAKRCIPAMLEFLIETAGFDPNQTDRGTKKVKAEGFTALHFAIRYADDACANSLARIRYLLEKTSSSGYLTAITKDSPIHLAAMYGKPNMLNFLFSVNNSARPPSLLEEDPLVTFNSVVNSISPNPNLEENDERRTLVALIPNKNAYSQTCLHVIPNHTISQKSIECVKIILNHPVLSYHRERLRFCLLKDCYGKTVIELAAEFETVPICQEILKNLRCDATSRWLQHNILLQIYKKIPDALLPVFNNSLKERSDLSRRQELMTLELAPIVGIRRKEQYGTASMLPETFYLNELDGMESKVKNAVLRNPLVENFVTKKYSLIRMFLLGGLLFQLSYIITYTLLAYVIFGECAADSVPENNSTNAEEHFCNGFHFLETQKFLAVVTIIYATMLLIKELYQVFTSKTFMLHFRRHSNSMQLLFTILTYYTTFSWFFVNKNAEPSHFKGLRIVTTWNVLLGGALALYELNKVFNFSGVSRILVQVGKRSLKLFAYYFLLIFAFTVSFRILTPENSDYMFPAGIAKVIAMMVGEYEFEDNFKETAKTNPYDTLHLTKLIVYLMFIFVAAIVALNLLIGLAVEDIQALKSDAHLHRLSCELRKSYMTEQFLLSLRPILTTRIYLWILERTNIVVNQKREQKNGYYDTNVDFEMKI